MKIKRHNISTFERRRNKCTLDDIYLSSVENHYEDQDSAFEDEPFMSEKEESEMAEVKALQKLHDVIERGEFEEFKHLIPNFDKSAPDQFNPRGFNSLHLSAKGGNFNIL